MNKSLIAILHYNSIQYTDALYEMLKPYERDDYDLIVIDNGSDEGKSSKYTTYRSDENTFYGGGLDMSLQLFIENKQYDSFALLNSDLIIHGHNFVKTLRKELFKKDDLMIVSPCIIQPKKGQCFWKQMHCWNSTTLREVSLVDYQCALMKRKFAETVVKFESKYGWVQDIMTSIICEQNNWKIGVCDWIPIVHMENGTVRDNPKMSNYNILAQQEADEYFSKRGLMEKVYQLKMSTINYKYE